MKLLGFNFDKIKAEKITSKVENIKINTKIDIVEIKEVKPDIFKIKEEVLGICFVYSLNYDPDFAKIEFKGNILLSVESKIAKQVLKEWEEKKMPEDFRIVLFNIILRKSSLRALTLEEELNLPLHIQPPSIKKQENKEE